MPAAPRSGRRRSVPTTRPAPGAEETGRRGQLPTSPARIRRLFTRYSPVWTQRLRAHPGDMAWLMQGAPLEGTRSLAWLDREWKHLGWTGLGFDETFMALREVKRREMLRITVRDLSGWAFLEETVAEISALADFCLRRGLDHSLADMSARHGAPSAAFAIFGMGKLGGLELNYSSDIDLIFAYSEEGSCGRLSHHDFYTRVVELLLKGFRPMEDDGSLFRVDLRLRPEGNSGPLTRSLESYENYYAAFGEVWERMALQKARFVAGDPELGYEFLQRLQPFCFPKHLPLQALDEIFEIKSRIEAEILKEGGLERHVKLGRGGIREIEFSVQALQLLHGARHAFSQERGTLKSLQALQRLDLINSRDAAALTRAYVFLRRVEHHLQMREDQQTHMVPEDRAERTRLAQGLGFRKIEAFEAEWKGHNAFVNQFFRSIVRPDVPSGSQGPGVDWASDSAENQRALREAGFADAAAAARTLRVLSHGPEYAHVSQRTRGLFHQICPHILRATPRLAQPDHALRQFECFIEAYGSRAALYELLASNPKVLELLLQLFDRSRFLSDALLRQPTLLDAIAFEGLLGVRRDRRGMEIALKNETAESPEQGLRLFQNSELLRIELRDILGLTESLEETCAEISLLADVCLAQVVRQASAPHLAIIALGKYGGQELAYGSDLDVLFVGGAPSDATRIMAAMGQDRGEGAGFRMDARLRPDGGDGPLTLPLDACARYYAGRAQFWERQALTRARPGAGDARLGADFLKMVDQTIYARPISASEMEEMIAMRRRIENERGDPQDPIRDFKTGAGGLVDVEFFAQSLQLLHGAACPSLRRLSTLHVLRAMPEAAGWKPEQVAGLVDDYLWLRKLECALRRDVDATASQLPEDRAAWNVLARHLGFEGGPSFEAELTLRRKRIRDTLRKLVRKEFHRDWD